MPNNNPDDQQPSSGDGDKPSLEQHNIAFDIDSVAQGYEAGRGNHARHEDKTLFWARAAGIGVGAYTLLTIPIMIAAIYSARTAGDAEVRQLRAYVVASASGVVLSDQQIPVKIRYVINNIGVTPATRVQLFGKGVFAPPLSFMGGTPPLDTKTVNYGTSVLSALDKDIQHSFVEIQPPISKDQWALFTIGPRRAEIYGEVIYRDVFNIDERHTWFCYSLEKVIGPSLVENGEKIYSGTWQTCPGDTNRFD
jgi:hypothetical protein